MNKKKYPVVNIGSSSMLVIFIILCLVIFSVLSLASANNDYAYSRKIADRTTAYYEAVSEAETLLSQIDTILYEARVQEGDGWLDTAAQTFKDAGIPALQITEGAAPRLSYQVPISESQALLVTLSLRTDARAGEPLYTIEGYQEISTREWEGDDAVLNLM